MEFKKYSSIENSYRTKFIEIIKEAGLNDGEFVVQEKVHGANFSIWVDKDEVKCAKRGSFLDGDAPKGFNNAALIMEQYKDNAMAMFEHLRAIDNQVEYITLCGELMGGCYPHDDVKKPSHARKIQGGVYYCPDNEFYGFDIRINGAIIDVIWACELFKKFKFFYAIPLFRGTFDQCLAQSEEFQTRIPQWLGLPAIEDNFAEGTVIKPKEPRFLKCGSRVILKKKHPKFSEHTKDKKVRKPDEPLEGAVLEAFEAVGAYVNENRLRNVLSKVGTIGQKEFGKLLGLFNKDVIEDFVKDHEAFMTLEKEDRKRITKEVNKLCASLIRDNFLNIVDGTF